jgi:hypothetical protein
VNALERFETSTAVDGISRIGLACKPEPDAIHRRAKRSPRN